MIFNFGIFKKIKKNNKKENEISTMVNEQDKNNEENLNNEIDNAKADNEIKEKKPEYQVSKVVIGGEETIDNPQDGIKLANRGKNIWMDITLTKKK